MRPIKGGRNIKSIYHKLLLRFKVLVNKYTIPPNPNPNMNEPNNPNIVILSFVNCLATNTSLLNIYTLILYIIKNNKV